jgi:hypothetical protein
MDARVLRVRAAAAEAALRSAMMMTKQEISLLLWTRRRPSDSHPRVAAPTRLLQRACAQKALLQWLQRSRPMGGASTIFCSKEFLLLSMIMAQGHSVDTLRTELSSSSQG